MAPGSAEAAHVSQAIHPPTEVSFRQAESVGLLVGQEHDQVCFGESIEIAVKEHGKKIQSEVPMEYQVSDTSRRVLRLIVGTCKVSNQWHGIKIGGNGNR